MSARRLRLTHGEGGVGTGAVNAVGAVGAAGVKDAGPAAFSECDWRPETETYDDEEVDVTIFTAMDELKRRLVLLINRWLIPAVVYTQQALNRFVVDTLLHEDLVEPDNATSYHVVLSMHTFNLLTREEYDSLEPSARNMLDLVIGSEEYTARHALLMSFVDDAIAHATEFVSAETQRFLFRTTEAATPPEAGILAVSGSPFVVPILYGFFSTALPSIKTWSISLLRLRAQDRLHHSRILFNGIVRLVLLHCRSRDGRRRTDGVSCGLAAAQLFTEQFAERYNDTSTQPPHDAATMMRPDSDVLHTLLSELFFTDKTVVVDKIIRCNALVPNTTMCDFVNVAFVVENVVHALKHGTLQLPPRGASMVTRVRLHAKSLVSARTRIRRALVLAFENPAGVSMKKLRAFALSCGGAPRGEVFTHMFQCFHVLAQGVMAGEMYSRREISILERRMTDISTAEETLLARKRFHAGPWRDAVTYTADDDALLSLAPLAQELALAAETGTITRKPWLRKDTMFLQSGVPKKGWMYTSTAAVVDPGVPGMWRVMNSFFNFEKVNGAAAAAAAAGRRAALFKDTDASQKVVDVAYGETVPTISHILNAMCCNSRDAREVSPIVLPVFVLLWNAGMRMRKALRENSSNNAGAGTGDVPVAVQVPVQVAETATGLEPGPRKRRRVSATALSRPVAVAVTVAPVTAPVTAIETCMACLEAVAQNEHGTGLEGCPHNLCTMCTGAMVEARVLEIFLGRGDQRPSGILACADSRCKGRVRTEIARHVLAPEVYAAFLFLTRNEDDGRPGAPHCNLCGAAAPADHDVLHAGPVFTCAVCNVMTCAQCERSAHPGDACVKRKQGLPTPEDLLSLAKIQRCPKCSMPEVKRRNCNHVFCKECATDWCWACASVLDSKDVTIHYKDRPDCVEYNTRSETERMRRVLLGMVTPELEDTVKCSLQLLSTTLSQTELDI